jgi:replication-associated recombination protein RarA
MAGAILFHGDDHDIIVAAMRKQAMELLEVPSVEALVCHGDYQEVAPTSKSYLYSMETIHSVVKESCLPPYRGKKRIIALLAVDRMLPVHANALLKTLEDAPLNFIMMLTTTAYDVIIKTILSRVQKEHVEGSKELDDYSSKLKHMLQMVKEDKYESFFKEVELLDKLITEDNAVSEGKFRHFLELFMKVYLAEEAPTHLFAARANHIQKRVHNAIAAFQGNIRAKHIIENLFLESQQQSYNTL